MIFKRVRPLTIGAALLTAVHLSAHDPIGTKVTWDREIAPILQARCVSCHSPNGRAPMPFRTYEEARPWARSMREEVLTRRMPKWHAVRGYGDFANDPSLSAFEIALIVAWVDGGAPRSRRPAAGGSAGSTKASVLENPSSVTQPRTRRLVLPCGSGELPAARILGLQPHLPEDGELRVILARAESDDVLLWVRGFDPGVATIYWLRTPIELPGPAGVVMHGPAECQVTYLLEERTVR